MKEVKQFQAESKELLSLMINSIYSNSEIFLRELISNASDAIDKYKYLSLTSEGKYPVREGEINLAFDKKKRTITISDNGIGMSKEDLINNLGTIAKSGSKDFVNKLKEAKEKQDLNIIGQFGVGFYSAFMVASNIEVLTKTVDNEGYLFTSEGENSYSIEEKEVPEVGTTIILHLKKSTKEVDYDEYLSEYKLKELVKKYSDYVRYPIKMMVSKTKEEDGKTKEYSEVDTLNSMTPLWKKNKKDVTDEELNSFYKEKFSDYEDPLISLFVKVDGAITYDALLYIPSHAPYNLYSDSFEKGLQLYSKGVFIKDKCPELVPDYLKFVKGLVDSPDFNLNISREILQQSPMMKKISENIEKKIIAKLVEVRKADKEKYKKFWEAFGEIIKYGIYSSYGFNKDKLQDLLVFHSVKHPEEYISLEDYKADMKKDQKYIYYVSGESIEAMNMLPQMEKYKKEEIDVLYFDKKIDEFCIMMMREFDKVEFKLISDESAQELSKEEKREIEDLTADNKRLLDNIKEALKDKVDDVVISSKLVDAPLCLTTKEGMSLEMEKTLKEEAVENKEEIKASKVLELNPKHELFIAFTKIQANDDLVKEYASILYDEAMLLEGRDIANKGEFVKKLNALLLKALQ